MVCVILPIGVYVVDIIITTKVIESKGYKHAMVHWQDDTNKNNKPIPKMNTFGLDDYQLKETWFFEVKYSHSAEQSFLMAYLAIGTKQTARKTYRRRKR